MKTSIIVNIKVVLDNYLTIYFKGINYLHAILVYKEMHYIEMNLASSLISITIGVSQ